MPLSELNGSIVPIYVDKCRPAESRTWIVVLLCNKSTFQGHVPYVMNNPGYFKRIKMIIPVSLMGLLIGVLPGLGGNISNLMAYSYAKKTSKHPETFGKGEVDGIIASETANNATVGGAMIILLTLGIPGDNATSIILAGIHTKAFLLHLINA